MIVPTEKATQAYWVEGLEVMGATHIKAVLEQNAGWARLWEV